MKPFFVVLDMNHPGFVKEQEDQENITDKTIGVAISQPWKDNDNGAALRVIPLDGSSMSVIFRKCHVFGCIDKEKKK